MAGIQRGMNMGRNARLVVGSIVIAALTLGRAYGESGDEPIRAEARIRAKELRVGDSYEIEVNKSTRLGWSDAQGGVPAPLIQIKVPDSATLEGDVLTGMKELATNNFLQAPYERLLESNRTNIKFTLNAEPSADDKFAFNVLWYLGGRTDEPAKFVRQRLELPLAPQSRSTAVDAGDSAWGEDPHLQLGEPADDFELPAADGSTVSLSQFKGKNNVIVTTYRAYW